MVPPPPSPEADEWRRQLSVDPASLSGLALMRLHAYRNPPEMSGTGIINTRRWRAAEVPSTNGHGNARAVARLYSALASDGELDGVHILSPEIIAKAIGEQVYADEWCCNGPRVSGSDSSSPWPSDAWALTHAPSGTSAPAARLGLPIPMRESPLAMP